MNNAHKNTKLQVCSAGLAPDVCAEYEQQNAAELCPFSGLMHSGPFFRRLVDEVQRAMRLHSSLGLLVFAPLEAKAQELLCPACSPCFGACAATMASNTHGGESAGHIGLCYLALLVPGAGPVKARSVMARMQGALGAEAGLETAENPVKSGFAVLEPAAKNAQSPQALALELVHRALAHCENQDDAQAQQPTPPHIREQHFFVEVSEKHFLFFGTVEQ